MIGIINTWSDINACHGHLRARAEDVKRGVYQAGGFPIELPAMSLAEPMVKPSTMLYRNFLAMEMRGIAAQPSDRRRGADGRLRQDHARPDHGRDLDGNSGDLCAGRSDAARQLARPHARFRLRRVEILGREARRPHRRRRVERDRRRHLALVRHLHGDGYRGDHDGDHRGAGLHACPARPRSRRRTPIIRACARPPAAARSTWCGRI